MKAKKDHKGETSFYAKQIKMRCYLCDKIGHKKENCWENDENKDKRPKGWKKNYQLDNKNKTKIELKNTKTIHKLKTKHCMLEMQSKGTCSIQLSKKQFKQRKRIGCIQRRQKE
jgi:hypothetical protein